MKLDVKVQDVIDLYHHSAAEWSESRKDSLDCYNACMNRQWTDKQIAYLLKTGRSPLVYNMIIPRLHNLYGTEQLNRKSARIRPSSRGQQGLADLLNGLWRAIWEMGEGEFELEKVFLDGLICKLPGSFEITISPDEMGYLEYQFNALNPFSVFYDPDYRNHNLKDCQFIIKEAWHSYEMLEHLYGRREEFKTLQTSRSWITEMANRIGGIMGMGDNQSEFYNKDGNKYKILEMQKREFVKRALLQRKDSGEYFIVPDSADEIRQYTESGESVYISTNVYNRIRLQTVVPYFNCMVVNEIDKTECDMYSIIPYHSFDYNNVESSNNSLVWTLLDPQRNLNKREIQKTNYLDHSINSPTMFSYEDKEAKEDMDEDGNRPGKNILVRNLKFPPRKLPPSSIGFDVWQDITNSVQSMNDISGINETARGQSEYSNESGKLFAMKAERTGATINPYFRNLSKTRKMIAEYFLKTVKYVYGEPNRPANVIETERNRDYSQVILNLTGIDGSIQNDVTKFEGRVILDEGEYSPTKLQENMQTKLVLAQMMPPEFVDWEYILLDSELPDIQKWVDYIKMVMGVQSEKQSMAQAQQMEQSALEQLALEKQINQTTEGQNNEK